MSPHLLFSDLQDLRLAPSSWKTTVSRFLRPMQFIALGLLFVAFIDPHFYFPKPGAADNIPKEGIAIYLVADQSGSMSEKITIASPDGVPITIPKIELLKQITIEFIVGDPKLELSGRPNDLIGLVAFARTAHVLSPLTLDHNVIVKELSKLKVVQNKEDDGTALGYALYKTANLIAVTRHYAKDFGGSDQPAYDIKSAIIILVTDGFDDPSILDRGNPLRNMDPEAAAKFAKENDVRIYIISIDPVLGSAQFAPQRHQMERVAKETGGKYYLISQAYGLGQIYKDIDTLEKSRLPVEQEDKEKLPHIYKRFSLYPYFIGLGMAVLFLSVILKTTLLRRVP